MPPDPRRNPPRPRAGDLVQEAIRILQASTEVTRVLDPEDIPHRAVAALHGLLHFPVVSVALVDPGTGALRYVADHGLPDEVRDLGFRPGGTARTVMATGQPLFVEDAGRDPRVNPQAMGFRQAYACLPLRHRENAYGLLFVNFADPHRFTRSEREILGVFSQQLAIALENATLHQQLKSALEQVKTLSGLIPICTYCKQVRTDRGFWQQVEAYLHERTEATFSHGICPACAVEVRKEVDALKPTRVILPRRPGT